MAPTATLNDTLDYDPNPARNESSPSNTRTLLLSPPSLSSRPELLNNVLAAHDRDYTDIQMLDRLSLFLVSLPPTTYDVILILTDADDTRAESKNLLTGELLSRIVKSLKPGGKIHSQDGTFGTRDEKERREAIFAGLMIEGSDLVKPYHEATESVPLRFGKKKSEGGVAATTSAAGTGAVSLNLNGKRKNGPPYSTQLVGVGFVDFSDDFGSPEEDDDDEELIDENTLLDEEDLKKPVFQRKPIMLLLSNLFANYALYFQHLSVVPRRVSVDEPAKIAPVASLKDSKSKTRPSGPTPIKPLRS